MLDNVKEMRCIFNKICCVVELLGVYHWSRYITVVVVIMILS